MKLAVQLFVVAAAALAQAEESAPVPDWLAHQPDRAWLEAYDPTLISMRLLTQFEFEDRPGGNSTAKWFWNARGAVPLTKDLALGLQLVIDSTTPDAPFAGFPHRLNDIPACEHR